MKGKIVFYTLCGILVVVGVLLIKAEVELQVFGSFYLLMIMTGFFLFVGGSMVLIRREGGKASVQRQQESVQRQQERWKLERASMLQRARNMEDARNFESAAQIYEQLGMFKEAGRVRKQSQVVKVTRTEVSVNLNSLLRQLRDGGIAVVYRCPNCSAPLKIGEDTKAESLKVCEHCGSEIEAVDVADFLRTALS